MTAFSLPLKKLQMIPTYAAQLSANKGARGHQLEESIQQRNTTCTRLAVAALLALVLTAGGITGYFVGDASYALWMGVGGGVAGLLTLPLLAVLVVNGVQRHRDRQRVKSIYKEVSKELISMNAFLPELEKCRNPEMCRELLNNSSQDDQQKLVWGIYTAYKDLQNRSETQKQILAIIASYSIYFKEILEEKRTSRPLAIELLQSSTLSDDVAVVLFKQIGPPQDGEHAVFGAYPKALYEAYCDPRGIFSLGTMNAIYEKMDPSAQVALVKALSPALTLAHCDLRGVSAPMAKCFLENAQDGDIGTISRLMRIVSVSPIYEGERSMFNKWPKAFARHILDASSYTHILYHILNQWPASHLIDFLNELKRLGEQPNNIARCSEGAIEAIDLLWTPLKDKKVSALNSSIIQAIVQWPVEAGSAIIGTPLPQNAEFMRALGEAMETGSHFQFWTAVVNAGIKLEPKAEERAKEYVKLIDTFVGRTLPDFTLGIMSRDPEAMAYFEKMTDRRNREHHTRSQALIVIKDKMSTEERRAMNDYSRRLSSQSS